jgi:hypothetical protein
VLWETMLGCGRVKLDGSVSCRSRGGATGALDREWQAAWAAGNGGQRLRRCSGEGLRSRKGNAVEEKCVSE